MSHRKQYILHSQHEWLGESHIHWTESNGPTRSHSFVVSDIGNCLILKLCGFVDEQQGSVEDVSENYLHLKLGGSQMQSLLSASACPLDLEIRLRPVESVQNPQSEVEVTIRDRRWVKQTSRFEAAARRVLCQLQYHLMASYE
jgi:sarcosine oxidase gamma subunit